MKEIVSVMNKLLHTNDEHEYKLESQLKICSIGTQPGLPATAEQ